MPSDTVLMLVTSHDKLGDTGRDTGLHLEEFTTPYYEITDAGWKIRIISPNGGEVPIDPGSVPEDVESAPDSIRRYLEDLTARNLLQNSTAVEQVRAEDYAGLFIPGGHGTMWDFPDNPAVIQLVKDMNRFDRPIAAVCHGPAALVNVTGKRGAPIVDGKLINGFTDAEEREVGLDSVVPFLLENRLRELGGKFQSVDAFSPTAVVDGNLMTGQNPSSAKPLAKKFVEALHGVSKAA